MANKLISEITEASSVSGSDYVEIESGGKSYSAKLGLVGGKIVGEIFYHPKHKPPSETFPAICLSSIDTSTDISSSNYPDLVTELRSWKLTYDEGGSNEKSAYSVTNWDVSSNVFTLTFEDATEENAILAALLEDKIVHGSYTDWRTITLDSDIGNIPAGTYAITEVDTLNRTVKGSVSASDGSGSVTATVEFYDNRIAGSSSTARLFEIKGRSLVSANDADSHYISGLRRRDQMQRITGSVQHNTNSSMLEDNPPVVGAFDAEDDSLTQAVDDHSYSTGKKLLFDSSGSPDARTSTDTDGPTEPKALSVHTFIWAGRYSS